MIAGSTIPLIIALTLAPLMQSVISRTKAIVAGRAGQQIAQPYRDLWKLLQKGAVYSDTSTWIFRMGPVVTLASLLLALAFVPFGGFHSLMALGRFFTVAAALDTGSSFEGMGASREVTFSSFAEPALFLSFAALVRYTGRLSLDPVLAAIGPRAWASAAPVLSATIAALIIVYLSENARIPFDDPTTHLELTMIHEVMVLDHSGPDLAMIEYGAALRMWLFAAIIVGIAAPWRSGNRWVDTLIGLAAMLTLAVATGLIESSMARLRLLRIPQLLLVAIVLSALALAF